MSDKPTPAPDPPPNWFERQEHALATGIHAVAERLDPVGQEIEADVEKAAAETWRAAAGALVILIDRNDQELTQKAEKAVMTYLLSLAPGAAPEADVIASVVLDEAMVFLGFVKSKLEAQAATPLAPLAPPLGPIPKGQPSP